MPGFSSITGQESVMFADNASFDGTKRGGVITTDGQFWIGNSVSPRVRVGTITSPLGTIAIGYAAPNITIDLAGGGTGIDSIGVDASTPPGTNPVLPTAGGLVTITGGQVAAGVIGANVIRTDSLAANTFTIEIQRSQAVATSTVADNGVSHFNSNHFSVDADGFVSALSQAFNYTNVTAAMSPYTVLATDYYLSVDCSAGAVQLNFPNAPTFKQLWIIKDRTGNAALNNITLTTPGGVVTFDGLVTYTLNSNFQAINLLANATPTYEVY